MYIMPRDTMQTDIRVRPLHPSLGAEVVGVDLRQPLTDLEWRTIREALAKHLVLNVAGQDLSEDQQKAFSRRFGPLNVFAISSYHHTVDPEITVITNAGPDGKPKGEPGDKGSLMWHTDSIYQRVPALVTFLHAKVLPRRGGDTYFANMYQAWEELPADLRKAVMPVEGQPRLAIHDMATGRIKTGDTPMSEAERAKVPPIAHPIVRTHPDTGRRLLYFTHHVTGIVGMPEDEALDLIERLIRFVEQDRFVYKHVWKAGDFVFWNNRATIHRATEFDFTGELRRMQRTVTQGTIPAYW